MIEKIKKDICGGFWTQFDEMLDEIDDAGYYVEYATEEYIEISPKDDEEDHYILYLGHANRTMWIENIKKA